LIKQDDCRKDKTAIILKQNTRLYIQHNGEKGPECKRGRTSSRIRFTNGYIGKTELLRLDYMRNENSSKLTEYKPLKIPLCILY